MAKYKATEGARINNKQAQILGEFLEAWSEKHNGIDPHALLANAEGIIIGDFLEWDNNIAANRYRLDQIYKILRSILKVTVEPDGVVREIRAFVPVTFEVVRPKEKKITITVYKGIEEVNADPEMRAQNEQTFRARMNSLRKQHGHIERYAKVWEAWDMVGEPVMT